MGKYNHLGLSMAAGPFSFMSTYGAPHILF